MEIISLRYCNFDYSKLLQSYIKLYEKTFTDESERESSHMWDIYIKTDPNTNHLPISDIIIIGKNLMHDNFQIFGGCNIEFYWKSKCCLMTYITIEEKYRRIGLAKTIYNFILSLLNIYYGSEVTIMCETENPEMIVNSSIDPKERIKIMNKLGGKRVPMEYIQPRLSGGFGRVSHLYLLCFNKKDYIESSIIKNFLTEFYDALSFATGDNNDKDLNSMMMQLKEDNIKLLSLNKNE